MPRAHNYVDLTGQRFYHMEAIEPVENRNGNLYWLFRCDCGETKVASGNSVKRGEQKSCGCQRRRVSAGLNLTHGESDQRVNRLYRIWNQMKRRCENPNLKAYPRYGGRGITVCPEWRASYEAFRDWALANGYEPHLSIDRRNNDGNYEPANCRWATAKEQANNRG